MRRKLKKIRFILAWLSVVIIPIDIAVLVAYFLKGFNELWILLPITIQGVSILGVIFITNFVEDSVIEEKRVLERESIEDEE